MKINSNYTQKGVYGQSFTAIKLPKNYSCSDYADLKTIFKDLPRHKFKYGETGFLNRVALYVDTAYRSVKENEFMKLLQQQGIKARQIRDKVARKRYERFCNQEDVIRFS